MSVIPKGTVTSLAHVGSLGTQTLLIGNANTAGVYIVSFYLMTTTAAAASSVTVTLSWDDGTARTEVIGLLGGGLNSNTVTFTAHDLTSTTSFAHASVVVKSAASKNITFITTVTSGLSPAYTIEARLDVDG